MTTTTPDSGAPSPQKRSAKMKALSELFSAREVLRKKGLSAKTPAEKIRFALMKHACEQDILAYYDDDEDCEE